MINFNINDVVKAVELMGDRVSGYDFKYERYAVEKLCNEAAVQKNELYNFLKKHPKWNEDRGAIIMPFDEVRNPDFYIASSYLGEILYYMGSEQCEYYSFIRRIRAFIEDYRSDTINDDFVEYVYDYSNEEIVKKFRLRRGQKISKVVRKFIDDFITSEKFLQMEEVDYRKKGIEKNYAKFSDAIKETKLKRTLLLSINPADFATMSNGNSWSSCHTFNGCHAAGTMSYALDKSSMILFTIDGDAMDTTTPKINRQVYCYADKQILMSRLYPNYEDKDKATVFRRLVEDIIAECLELENKWVVKKERFNTANYGSLHYPDFHYGYNCRFAVNKSFYKTDLEPIGIGSDGICLNCGCELESSNYVLCSECRYDGYECYHCGSYVSRNNAEEVYWQGHGWTYICSEHIENGDVVRCDHCGDWNEYDNMYQTKDGYCYCSDCVDEHTFTCYKCGELYSCNAENEADGELYCGDCYGDLEFCSHCGAVLSSEDTVYTSDGDEFCQDCADRFTFICDRCNGVYLIKDAIDVGSEHYCENCAEYMVECDCGCVYNTENNQTCPECGEMREAV